MAKVRKVDDLRSMFPNHTVLGVNGQSVALLNEKGRCCSYTFQENENTVVPERIEEIAVNSVFGEGENAINISAEELVGAVQAKLLATQNALTDETKKRKELETKINEMTEAERKRRKKVVEKAIRSRLDENRKDCGDDIDEHLCDDMLTDDCVGKYAEMEKDGEFCGDAAAQTEVDARCMRKLKEASKARKNSTKISYAYLDGLNGGEEPQNDVDALLNEYGAAKKS